jgi:hypothetical protein
VRAVDLQRDHLLQLRDPIAILSRLLERLEAEGNDKGIEALNRISPVAWQHILLNGHYTFQSSNEIIDLDVLVAVETYLTKNLKFQCSGVKPYVTPKMTCSPLISTPRC